jgi:hypothetical protein
MRRDELIRARPALRPGDQKPTKRSFGDAEARRDPPEPDQKRKKQ